MRIRTLLNTSVSVAMVMVVGLAIANWLIAAKLDKISAAEERAQATAHAISNLLVLTHEYALYAEERTAQQWEVVQKSIADNLAGGVDDPVPSPATAREEAMKLPELFRQLRTAMSVRSDLQSRQRNLLLSQLQTHSQVLSDSVLSWNNTLHNHIHKNSERAFRLLTLLIPVLMLLILACLTFIIDRRVLRPLSHLNRAVRAVAKGDLTVRSSTAHNDEFGELSRTFDAMAIDMVAELKQEISERIRVEDELKRVGAALKESEYFFKESQRSAHIGSYRADFTTNTWTSSEVLDTIFGIDAQYDRSVTGWLDIVHPDDRNMMDQYLREEVIAKKASFSKEYRIIRQNDGEMRWVCGLGEATFDAQGSILQLIGTIQDITERRKHEEERAELEKQLQQVQKLESLGVLAGGIAHDFNNILMAIIGNADMALMRINRESPATENLHRIEQAAARAADLAKQMLAYSGKGKFVIEHINLNDLMREMLHMLEVSISKKSILRLNLHQHLPTVEADATQIRQVVMNLVINASEAIGERSGVIAITTGCMDCDKSYLKNVWLDENIREGLYVFLEVADTGCGMDKETMSKLFDPFFTTKFTGRGLGMAAVLGIVRGHKGAIRIYSEPGKGTTFKVLLPASNRPPEIFNGESVHDNWRGSGTVLLVDDEETVRGIGKEMLQELGFSVITANDGREALQIFKTTPDIVLVVLDLTMPHVDGEQCFRELKQLQPEVRVVISSGYNEQEVAQKFAGKGLAGFIQKPYKLSLLKEIVRGISAEDSGKCGVLHAGLSGSSSE